MRAFLLLLLLITPVCAASWPGVAYSEVRGYAYESKQFAPLVVDGKLGPTVVKKADVRLTPRQIQRLVDARRHANNRMLAQCWSPHHGFVFYDAGGRAVAWVEVCFKCDITKESPLVPAGFDMKALRKLSADLKLPNLPKKT